MSPKVSIGMPVYNGEEYLRGALDSILDQTFGDFEVVISDNASEDGTREICESYAARDARVRYYRADRNRGAAWNYNTVVAKARGTYFKWAAHDDWIDPTYVERCVEEFEAGGDGVSLVYPRTILVCEDPAEREFYGGERVRYQDRLDTRSDDPVRRLCHVAMHLDLCNAVMGMFLTELLRQTQLIRPFAGSDVLLLSEISLLGEIHEIPEYLFYRRRHPQASRLANRSSLSVARWFASDASGGHGLILTPGRRLLWEHVKLVSTSSLPLATRVRGVVGYLGVRAFRRIRVVGGRYRRRIFGHTGSLRASGEDSSEAAS